MRSESRMIRISVSALSSEPSSNHVAKAKRLITLVLHGLEQIGCDNVVFYIGGYAGLMKVAVDTILEHNSEHAIVAILPIEYENTRMPSKVIQVRTGMSFQNRNPILVRSGDFLLSLGGGAGTIMEVYNAVALGKMVLHLVKTGTASDYLYNSYPDGVIDPLRKGKVTYADPDEPESKRVVNSFLSQYC